MPRQKTSILVPVSDGTPLDTSEEARSFVRVYVTERQIEILSWARHGKSARDIGDILGISPRTVENLLRKACLSLEVKTRVQAVVKAKELGIIT